MSLWNPKAQTQYHLQELLGEGLTSCVYGAIRKHRQLNIEHKVALKIFKSKNTVQTLKNEIKILTQVQSHNCVRFLGWDEYKGQTAVVLEYLDGVSLYELVFHHSLDEQVIAEIIIQIQQGLKDLSKHKICHGDISPKNIFITTEGVVKILDFGYSCAEQGSIEYSTLQYMAPEIWRGGRATGKSDLFSLGLLWHDLLKSGLRSNRSRDHWRQRAFSIPQHNVYLRANPDERSYVIESTKEAQRVKLAKLVLTEKKHRLSKTLKIRQNHQEPIFRQKMVISSCLFLILFLLPYGNMQFAYSSLKKKSYNMMIKSQNWAQVKVYRKNKIGLYKIHQPKFTPMDLQHLESGEYEIHWQSSSGKGKILVHLNQNKRIIIK